MTKPNMVLVYLLSLFVFIVSLKFEFYKCHIKILLFFSTISNFHRKFFVFRIFFSASFGVFAMKGLFLIKLDKLNVGFMNVSIV